jgi:hypothetical protein
MRTLLLFLLAAPAFAQTLTVPLPPGCTAPTLSGTTVSCSTTPVPPTCPATPPVCPTQPPAGCAPCTPPPVEPPAVSCGDLKVVDGGEFSFSSQMTRAIQLGKGDKEVYILRTTPAAVDAGRRSSINIVEHGSGIHAKTLWASRTKCEMTNETRQGANSSPSAWVSVNGTEKVNMAPGETWYFMFRNLTYSGKNSCSSTRCGELITAYLWQAARDVNETKTAIQKGGPLPKRDRPK